MFSPNYWDIIEIKHFVSLRYIMWWYIYMIYIHTYIYTYIHIYTHTYIHTHIVCVHTYTNIYTYIYIHIYIRTYTYCEMITTIRLVNTLIIWKIIERATVLSFLQCSYPISRSYLMAFLSAPTIHYEKESVSRP